MESTGRKPGRGFVVRVFVLERSGAIPRGSARGVAGRRKEVRGDCVLKDRGKMAKAHRASRARGLQEARGAHLRHKGVFALMACLLLLPLAGGAQAQVRW